MVSVAVLIQVKRSLRREHFENTHIADKGKVCFHIILQSCAARICYESPGCFRDG
jgi:hypothetical protein